MNEFDVLIFINSAGENVRHDNIFDTLFSISKNINLKKYGFYIVGDNNITNNYINDAIKKLKKIKIIDDGIFIKIIINQDSYANNFNKFFDDYKDKTEHILISHDDIEIRTFDFFNKTIDIINDKIKDSEIGWITWTSDHYYKDSKICIANSIRPGMHLDFDKDNIFELHNWPKIQYPRGPVRCHGPYTHFNLIKTQSLKKIGYCEDWAPYTLLVDEDWALESLRHKMINVWIPDIFYTHPLRMDMRINGKLKYEKESNDGFRRKWNFTACHYNEQIIKAISEHYKGTDIAWSANKYSYDWVYI